ILQHIFRDLLDSVIFDVASESHRILKLGLDRNLDSYQDESRSSAEAATAVTSDPTHSGESNGKYVIDIYGQTHPAIADEIFGCMNCGRTIMAGRFAPHLEKCMGKGRKARLKKTRSSSSSSGVQNRNSSCSPGGCSAIAGHEYSNGAMDE
ncbi:hypothetical protein M569_16680, partial [Genlisea aurea]